MTNYSYDRFRADAYDLDSFHGPKPGDKASDFDLTDSHGLPRRLLDFEGRFLVLELGSITCPLFQGRRNAMAALLADNPDVSFAVLYIREAHPGTRLAQPGDLKTKTAHACQLRDAQGEGRDILVDDLAGSAHRAFGGYPNSVFIVNRAGCVVYRADWNNPRATARALRRLKQGRAAGGEGLFLPAPPHIAIATLRAAGGHALGDFLKDLPRLIWKNAIRRNLRVLFGRRDHVLPDHIC